LSGPRRGALTIWFALCVLSPLVHAEDLEQLREAIDDSRARVGQHEARERDLLEQIEDTDARLEAVSRQVDAARQEAQATRAELERVERETQSLAVRLDKTRRSLAARAVALYKQGEIGAVRVLFSSDSLADMVLRWGSLRTLVRTDAALALRFRQELSAHALLLEEVEAAAERSEAAARELGLRSQRLAAEREQKRRLAARVHEDRVLERELLVELERAARTLEETIGALGDSASRPRAADVDFVSDFADRRGHLLRPVDGPLRSPFGRVVDTEFRTETFRRGADFAAKSGAPVRAVAGGVVRFQGWFRGYGKIVVLDHGGNYFTVSGHLSEIHVEVGDRVSLGDVIGAVGDTGSLAGPGLYFELRRGGEPLDPEEWLQVGREHSGRIRAPAKLARFGTG